MGTLLDRMEPLLAAMPAVRSPEGHVHFKNKLLWTAGILILYFVMTNIPLWGLDPNSQDLFQFYRALVAGASGSLVQLGIGPIVTASIVLQLLKGADILHIDTSEVRGQVIYMGLQKLLIFVMIIIEALPNLVGGFLLPDPAIANAYFGGNLFAVSLIIFIQICIGGVLIMFMDEVVTKWGIGSGVGLFIIAGISQAIVNGLISWIPVTDQYAVGFFPRLVQVLVDGADFIQYMGPEMLAFITTIAIFLIVTYVESTRIEIPLAHAQVRGARARFPVKLIYASVLPMILVRVLQANIQMIGLFLYNIGITIFGTYQGAQAVSGLMYYLAPINAPSDWMWWVASYNITQCPWQIMIRLGVDISLHGCGRCRFRPLLDQDSRSRFKGCSTTDPALRNVDSWLPEEPPGP